MRRRALVAAVAGWVTVVGATSAVAWVAIDRAGREVLTATSDARVDPGAVTTGAPHTPRPPRTQAAPTTAATSPTSSRAATSTSAPPATTSSRSSTTSPAGSSSSRPRTTTRSSAPKPAAVDRTVRVEGGQVGVRCVAQTASLRFAQPDDGWSVRVEDDGPEHVKVTFRSSGDRREIEIESQCSGGTPVFSTSDDERRENASHPDD